ncbi:MAG: 6,7-dimethyl-8-ribityllumazine synthase [Pseudomonadota bacterium]
MAAKPHLLIVEARFYEDISDELFSGAEAELESSGATFDKISVPGCLEIPAAISMALYAAEDGGTEYDGFVALGCVIRGETSHYDIVAGDSARALMDLSIDENIPLGNGIITCENTEQAWARARVTEKNKGGGAASAALAMIEIRRKLSG